MELQLGLVLKRMRWFVAPWNSLINGFVRDEDLNRARDLFVQMLEKNVVSWTTMTNGFSQNGDHERALSMFWRRV